MQTNIHSHFQLQVKRKVFWRAAILVFVMFFAGISPLSIQSVTATFVVQQDRNSLVDPVDIPATIKVEVPKAAVTPQMDGEIDPNSEYLGAAMIPLDYGEGYSTIVYLVRTDTALYIGVPGIRDPERTPQGFPGNWNDAAMVLMLDTGFTRDITANRAHLRVEAFLNLDDDSAELQVGDGNGSYDVCSVSGDDVPAADCGAFGTYWEVAQALTGDDVAPGRSIEFRIAKSLLGEWEEVDGLAVESLYTVSSNESFVAPADAVVNSPATWAEISYTDGSAELPRAQVSGSVLHGLEIGAPPLIGHTVSLIAGSLLYQQVTGNNGTFSFDVPVPADEVVRVRANNCGFCRYATPNVDSNNIQPQTVNELDLNYPGCSTGTCTYANVDFFILTPPDAVSIAGATPEDASRVHDSRHNAVQRIAGRCCADRWRESAP